jgi:glutathione S-transferase
MSSTDSATGTDVPDLHLTVLSLRYSSWSIRPWLVLTHAGAQFEMRSVELEYMRGHSDGTDSLESRRGLGSVHGLFPVLRVDGTPIHESLAICEYVAEAFPAAKLWPADIVGRAEARAVSAEMHSGFASLRNEMPCCLFARTPAFEPSPQTRRDIDRIFEIWRERLERSGGPFLFGDFTIADAMYFPVLSRFRTFAVELPPDLIGYAESLESLPAVKSLLDVAAGEPRVPLYDDIVTKLGGNPDAALPSR